MQTGASGNRQIDTNGSQQNFIYTAIAKSGHKNTKSRTAVVKVLSESILPISAVEILEKMAGETLKADLSTVYRTLTLLVENRLLVKTVMSDGTGTYLLRSNSHKHYITCTNCRSQVEISGCPLSEVEREIGEATDFYMTGHKLELFGICPKCRRNEQLIK